jgi:hypothetical protein
MKSKPASQETLSKSIDFQAKKTARETSRAVVLLPGRPDNFFDVSTLCSSGSQGRPKSQTIPWEGAFQTWDSDSRERP